MDNLKVAIIEEPVLGNWLKENLCKLQPSWEVSLLPETIKSAVQWFGANEGPDLIFVDTDLIDGDIFSLLAKVYMKGILVFISDSDKYALRAFSVDCLDYLVKPITFERLEQTILKHMRLIGFRQNYFLPKADTHNELMPSIMRNKRYRNRVLVSSKNRYIPIDVNNISFFFSQNKITYVVTFDESRYTIDLTLSQLEMELNPDYFYRINRQYILSVHSIIKIEHFFNKKYTITLKPECDTNIVIGSDKIALLKNWLDY